MPYVEWNKFTAMKFDTIIIGGGLSGLTCALRLQAGGRRCAVISAGQSALHFSSGSFDLLGLRADRSEIESPLDEVKHLREMHPYHKLGDKLPHYAAQAESLLAQWGIRVKGDARKNHFRYTPMGGLRPTWLTFSELAVADDSNACPGERVLVANFPGFLDFNTSFITDALCSRGAKCEVCLLDMDSVNRLRVSSTEMRAANIAKVFESEEALGELIAKINQMADGYDCVVLPAVFGFSDAGLATRIEEGVRTGVAFLPAMPPSVAGIRTQKQLRTEFERMGGVFIPGDEVVRADIEDGEVKKIYTRNHGEMGFSASNYVLATGHFMSGGLKADAQGVYEPVFGSDVYYLADRGEWFDKDFFRPQAYSTFGVETDAHCKVLFGARASKNLYAAGSVLCGADAMHELCGGGVSLLTALYVADEILK